MKGLQKILIVEDDPSSREILAGMFPSSVYEIFTAVTGRHGFEIIEREDIDLVLLDLGLPDIEGVDFLKELKADKCTQDIEVIVVTIRGDSKTTLQCLNAGAFYFTNKDADIEAVQFLAKKALQYRAMRMEKKKGFLSNFFLRKVISL